MEHSLQALKVSGLPEDHPVWEKAIKLIQRTQNLWRSAGQDLLGRVISDYQIDSLPVAGEQVVVCGFKRTIPSITAIGRGTTHGGSTVLVFHLEEESMPGHRR